MNYRQLAQYLLNLSPDQMDMEVMINWGNDFFPIVAALTSHVDDVVQKGQPFLVVLPELEGDEPKRNSFPREDC